MKKLLNKLEPGTVPLSSGPSGGQAASQSGQPAPTATTNSLIGKTYKLEKGTVVTIEETLAEGGFGLVFIAKYNGNQVGALKRIVVNNEVDLQVATREIAIMSTLGVASPYILPCVDSLVSKVDADVTEIVSLSPFCKSNLLTLLQNSQQNKAPLKEPDVLRILSDVVQGVARLHHCTTPIIHRDLKIENILEQQVNGGGSRFVICDFGSATGKFWDPEVHSVTAISEELEKYTTLAYRAPEMVDLYSNRGAITTKADIWALGIATYKMLYYVTPFGDSILAIQSAKLDFPPCPPYSRQMQLLIQYMLLADQSVRPDIFQVSELVHSLLSIPNPVQNLHKTKAWTFDEIENYRPSVLVETKIKNSAQPAGPVLLETSVTPRSRPKPGGQLQPVVAAPSVSTGDSIIMPPPKSPKVGRKVVPTDNAATTEEAPPAPSAPLASPCTTPLPPPTQPSPQSWNPFDTSSSEGVPASAASPSQPPADDPFALAPFDYFQYQPMMVVGEAPQDMFGSEPFSNPFLDFNNSHTVTSTDTEVKNRKGVTNYSFED